MARTHGPSKKDGRSRSTLYASQVIYYAGKYHLMRDSGLRKIGKSTNFHDLLLNVSREEPKNMKVVLRKALIECSKGQEESAMEKKARKRARDDRIEMYSKRQKRADATKPVEKTVNKILKIKPLLNSEEADDDSEAVAEKDEDENEGVNDEEGQDEEEERQDDNNGEQDGKDMPHVNEIDETSADIQIKSDSVQTPGNCPTPSEYDRQLALVRGEPLRIDNDECRFYLANLHASKRLFDINSEFEAVLENCVMKLDPEPLRDALVEYLDNRLETKGSINPPTVSDSSSAEDILEVLHALSRICEDAKIRCAVAQMMLYLAVERQCRTRGHLEFLRALASKKAGKVSQKESTKIYKSYEKDYYHGKKWLDIVDMFGGDGIVILFVLADIGPWTVTSNLTAYQRDCLLHISVHLFSVRKLVDVLEPKAAERYCQFGYLEKATVDNIASIDLFEE